MCLGCALPGLAAAPSLGHKATPQEPSMSSVQINDLQVGTGKECPKGATVTVHYRGTLMDGKEFDSSYKRGQPIEFPLPQLIQGWQEGIPGMKVGGKRELVIPWAKAYGERGAPPSIPPKADLKFEIELLGVR
jgi:FKBP-type peptidyl-prolyl cis-trans isomerase FkpA